MNLKKDNNNIFILSAFFMGFTCFGYEIITTKILFYFFDECTLPLSTLISLFLLGIALGSFMFSKIEHKAKDKNMFLALTQIFIALYALVILPNFDLIPISYNFLHNILDNSPQTILIAKLIISFTYFIFPTVLMGLFFSGILTESAQEFPKQISTIYTVGLLGAVLGSILSGYWFIPFWSIKSVLFISIILNIVTASLLLMNNYKKLLYILIPSLAVLIIACINFKFNPLPTYFNARNFISSKFDNNTTYFIKNKSEKELFFKKSPYGEIRVIELPGVRKTLYINNRVECTTLGAQKGNISNAHKSEVLYVNEVLREFDNRKDLKVLNVGLGCGFSLGAIANSTKVQSVDVVEINPVVPEVIPFFKEYNQDILNNKKVNLIIDDGYKQLLNNKKKYDMIVLDVENPSIMHSNPLYSYEFYKLVQKSLKKDGIYSQWAYLPDTKVQTVNYNTLAAVFDYVVPKTFDDDSCYFLSRNYPFKKVQLSKDDETFFYNIKNSKNRKIHTLKRPAMSIEWIKNGNLNVDKY